MWRFGRFASCRSSLAYGFPEDISVLGFDGTQMCDHTTPRLSSVRQPVYEMAARGVGTLAARLRGEPLPEPADHLHANPVLTRFLRPVPQNQFMKLIYFGASKENDHVPHEEARLYTH